MCVRVFPRVCKGSSIQILPNRITHVCVCLTKPHKFIACLTESLKHWMPSSWNSTDFRDSTGWIAGVRFPGRETFSSPTASRPALWLIQPHFRLILGTVPPGIKRPGMKLTTHLCQERRTYTCTPQYVLMSWYLIDYAQGQIYRLPFYSASVSHGVLRFLGAFIRGTKA
jgi:hypothetical protein